MLCGQEKGGGLSQSQIIIIFEHTRLNMTDSRNTNSENMTENLLVTQRKVQELAESTKKLREEAERLKSNIDKMHQLQTTLYRTDLKVLEWLEAGNRLKDVQIPLEKVIAFINKKT